MNSWKITAALHLQLITVVVLTCFVMWGCFDNRVGVIVICVLVFTVFCIFFTFLYCFVYVYIFLFVLSVLV